MPFRSFAAKRLEDATLDLTAFFKAEFAEHHDVARRSEAALSNTFAELVRARALNRFVAAANLCSSVMEEVPPTPNISRLS